MLKKVGNKYLTQKNETGISYILEDTKNPFIPVAPQPWMKEPISKYLDIFLQYQSGKGNSEKTIIYYRDEISAFIKWMKKNSDGFLGQVYPHTINSHLDKLEKTRNKGGIHARFRALRAFFNFIDNEFTLPSFSNPMRKISRKAPNPKPQKGAEIATIQKLIDACKNSRSPKRDKAILACLLSSGLRAQELLDLNVEDVDQWNGTIQVLHGKGGKSRVAFFDADTTKLLRRYLRTRANLSDSSPLFVTQNSETRLTYHGLREIIRRRSENAGIEAPAIHDFRRSFALKAFRNGMDILTLSTLLGHSSVAVTRRYLNIDTNDLAREYRKIRFLD